jgi:RNA recognition motif-containing protein
MAANLVVHDDSERSNSPPGRETREEWWNGSDTEPPKNDRPPISQRLGERKERSGSMSPLGNGAKDRGSSSPNRELRYTREGTNTTSREPHLERARLFVGNIEPNRTHRGDIFRLFSKYGDVLGVSVHKGYAFVQMDRERTANKAINAEDNQMFMGSKIRKFFLDGLPQR